MRRKTPGLPKSLPLPEGYTHDEALFLVRAWFTPGHPPEYEDKRRFHGVGPTLPRTEAGDAFLLAMELRCGPPRIPDVYPYSNIDLPEPPPFVPALEDLDVAHEPKPPEVPSAPAYRLSRVQRLRQALFGRETVQARRVKAFLDGQKPSSGQIT
jgi:hypothetical protein